MININGSNYHSISCASEFATDKSRKKAEKDWIAKVKKDSKLHRQRKRELKDNDRKHQVKKTQEIFNKFIRLRDKASGCISCNAPFHDKYDAGHYRSTGAHPELRFCELNNHGQCVHCNQHLSGNLIDYRIGLVRRISATDLEWLEGHHEPKKYTIEELKDLQQHYKQLIKEIENEISTSI